MAHPLESYQGIIPAMMTPYDKNDCFNPSYSQEMVDWMIHKGVGGFYLTGSNGTGPHMDVEERIRVVDTITKQVDGRVPVVAHIGHVSTKNSIRMAKAAQEAGCMAISAVPSYYITLDEDSMQRYYEEIAAAVKLPMIVYAQTDKYRPSVEMFQRLAEIENVWAVKYTGADMYMMGRIKAHVSKLRVYSGFDEMMLCGQLMGADGAIGGTYNVIPEPYIRAKELFEKGDLQMARKYIMAANTLVEMFFKFDIGSCMREGLGLMGVHAGKNPSPNRNMNAAERQAYIDALKCLHDRFAEDGITDIELLNAAALI